MEHICISLTRAYLYLFKREVYYRFQRYLTYLFNKALSEIYEEHSKYIFDNVENENHALHMLRHSKFKVE